MFDKLIEWHNNSGFAKKEVHSCFIPRQDEEYTRIPDKYKIAFNDKGIATTYWIISYHERAFITTENHIRLDHDENSYLGVRPTIVFKKEAFYKNV